MRPYSEIGAVAQLPPSVELAPGADVAGGAALAGLGEDRVDLRDGQALDGVVLVDKDRQGVEGDIEALGLVAEGLLEGVGFLRFHLARHVAELDGPLDECRRRGGGTLALDLDLDLGVELAELLGHEGLELEHGVGTGGVERAAKTFDLGVARKIRIETRAGGEGRPGGGQKHQNEN